MRNFISGMVEETKKGKNQHGVLETIICLALIITSQSISGIVIAIIEIGKVMVNFDGNSLEFDINPEQMIADNMFIMLFGTIFTIILVLIYTKFLQKRSLYSVGLGKTNALKDYFIGYAVGIVMFSAVILILVVTNNLSYEKATISMLPMVVVFFLGFLIQGASEEVALRGYLMNSLAAKHNLLIAVLVNSSIFGVLHLGNQNVTLLSVLNIILFGLFASIYALKFNNIWGVCALHSAWNFVQGNIFGLEVSGNKTMESLWHFKAIGSEILNGGSFGPEGGLAATIILSISIVIIYLLKTKRNEQFEVSMEHE